MKKLFLMVAMVMVIKDIVLLHWQAAAALVCSKGFYEFLMKADPKHSNRLGCLSRERG